MTGVMPHPESFIGLSALGLTVTGFSGLISVLGRRASALELPKGAVPLIFLGGTLLIASAAIAGFGYIGGLAPLLVSNILWLLMIAIIHFDGLLMNPGPAQGTQQDG
ncbi:MAG: hypothetical protein CMD83_18735 [Gammaproteobacteria bacterium]|nr:hypothetical protein [Gammaproteobacteria bacterium]|tara:strand:- start:468 stop:788 length:321 start_codon:yes stop_codon:yes gene_type:complete